MENVFKGFLLYPYFYTYKSQFYIGSIFIYSRVTWLQFHFKFCIDIFIVFFILQYLAIFQKNNLFCLLFISYFFIIITKKLLKNHFKGTPECF